MKIFLNWSGGKDACMALWRLQRAGTPAEALLTSVAANGRVSMHGVPLALVEAQATALELPLHILSLPEMPGMAVYETVLQQKHAQLKAEGFTHAAYGDLFLEDLKAYRDKLLGDAGLQGLYPVWGSDSRAFLEDFWSAGFKAIVVCVNGGRVDKSFCGRELDELFIADLPAGVDPCGENGEFHTFVYDGPLFRQPVPFIKTGIEEKSYPAPKTDDCFTEPLPPVPFYFCGLKPEVLVRRL
jgi:uncharacterized protein (TIGR00290 family)